ncbi:transposase [Xenorhabdus nematophila ATCC 19061]|uniref:Transposase n=1 Tax=Xenorhabdus nematophila (strain ATCC 19061 / DSM 3370 / CCUG 14189 / LMG 1036 / NCIMB 9965 / AN6) TaxID=406817 RepID=D3VGC3_XENNA|nr:IS110 family transposase [Xenorhabdus nematophila]CBJ88213.1 transposase [Xenorhabdus nematophila ATCC 19061]CEK21131.1 transposase [Xenorhabdus nematophila AN6/1]
MEQVYYCGIDIAKSKFDCAIRLNNGKYKDKVFKNESEGFSTFINWLAHHGFSHVHICMEATGIYWEAFAEYLADKGLTVSVINPAQIKAFSISLLVRNKTDREDARVISDFCFERKPAAWLAPSASEQSLWTLVLRLESLQKMRTQENNRLHVARENVTKSLTDHIAWLNNEIEILQGDMLLLINGNAEMKQKKTLLESIPGLGVQTAAVLLSFGIHPGRFVNARQAAAYAGVDPRLNESGSSVKGRPRLSKTGHAFLRKPLYMPAMTTLFRTAWGKHFYARLTAAGKAPKLIIGAMMRKLIHVAFGVLKTEKSFDQSLHGV